MIQSLRLRIFISLSIRASGAWIISRQISSVRACASLGASFANSAKALSSADLKIDERGLVGSGFREIFNGDVIKIRQFQRE